MHLDVGAVDQQGVERAGQVTPQRTPSPNSPWRPPVASVTAPGGQRRPEHDRVEMAGMVGKVDPLARVGLAIDPAHAGPAKQSGNHGQKGPGHLVWP